MVKPREGTAARLGQVSRHTAAVLLANLLTLLLGLLVTVIAARLFGTGPQVDAFFVALSIPQVASQILLSVALLVIVPAYAARRKTHGVQGAQSWMAPLFYVAALVLTVCAALLALAAPTLIRVVAPGFDPQAGAEGAKLLAWLAPSIVLMGLSGILQGIANAHGYFFKSAWARTLPAFTGVVGLVLLHPSFGFTAFAWGMTVGALLGLAWQWHEVMGFGWFQMRLHGFWSSLAEIKNALGLIILARAVVVGGGLVSATVASTVAVGTVAVLGYAFRIVSIPFLLSASFGVVIFPALALARVEEQECAEGRLLDNSIRLMGLFGLASAIPLFLWAAPLVSVLFERGEFGPGDTLQTARALQVFAVAIPLAVVNTQVGNSYWARGLRVSRMLIELAGVVTLLVCSFTLGPRFGVGGLAAAVALQYAVQMALAVWPVPQLVKAAPGISALNSLRIPLWIALGVCVAVLWTVPGAATWNTWSWLLKAIVVSTGMACSVGLFLGSCFLFEVPEVDRLLSRALAFIPSYASVLDEHQRSLLAARARGKLFRFVSGWWPFFTRRPTRYHDLPGLLSSKSDVPGLVTAFRESPMAFGCYAGGSPCHWKAAAAESSDLAQNRVVDLLGSGKMSLGTPIAWHKDYVSGYAWPRHRMERLVLVDLKSDADCKFPWELARCQHWPHLASGADRKRSVQEILSQFAEFTRANPPGCGITYGNAMEVAIRSVNWILAFRAIALHLTDEQVQHLAVEMGWAGRFIQSHLEHVERGLNSNHYIADLLGLYVISTYFPSLKLSPHWYRWAGDELGAELSAQFDAEGIHREGSPAYARLVLEFYLAAYLLGTACNDPRVDSWRPALERALDALCSQIYLESFPPLGDDDSGRLLVPPGEPPSDHRYLLQIGAVLWSRADWKAHAGVSRPGLEFWLGQIGTERYEALPVAEPICGTCVFQTAGLAVHRTPRTLLVLQGGRRETPAPRGHLHNDLTSLLYCADGERWLLDPGTYQYSRRAVWRNRFRSTAVHNVAQIDGCEQNPFRRDWLFHLGTNARPLPILDDHGELNSGYELPSGHPCHRVLRSVRSSHAGRLVSVLDRLEGGGRHDLTIGWNVARRPFSYLDSDLIIFRSEKGNLLLHLPASSGLTMAITESWVSPRFGVRERCFRVEAKGSVTLPWETYWGVAAFPCQEPQEAWVQRLRADREPAPLAEVTA